MSVGKRLATVTCPNCGQTESAKEGHMLNYYKINSHNNKKGKHCSGSGIEILKK